MRPCANAIFARFDAKPLIVAAHLETRVESGVGLVAYIGVAADARCGSFAAPGLLHRCGGDLWVLVAARGVRGRTSRARRLSVLHGRALAGDRPARARRRTARIPQQLPPPRVDPVQARARDRRAADLPLSSLDLWARRAPARRRSHAGGFPEERARAAAAPTRAGWRRHLRLHGRA